MPASDPPGSPSLAPPTSLGITLGGPRFGSGTPAPLGPFPEALEAFCVAIERPRHRNAWWSGSSFEDGRRTTDAWRSASVLGLDLDAAGHAALPPAAAEALAAAARCGELPGHVFHLTPAGARLVVLLAEPITDRDAFADAVRGFAAEAQEALGRLGIDAVAVDAGTLEAARLYFTPNAHAKGVQRCAEIVRIRSVPVFAEVLAERAEDYTEPELPGAPAAPRGGWGPAGRRTSALRDFAPAERDALRAWAAAHAPDPARGTCPVCAASGKHDSRWQMYEAGRWTCFGTGSAHRLPVGTRTVTGTHNGHAAELEVLGDLPADATRDDVLERVRELLRAGGFLAAERAPTPFAEVHAAVRAAIAEGLRADRSRAIVAPPGVGKTTAALDVLADELRAAGRGVAVLALPTRADVDEKAATARRSARERADALGLMVPDLEVATVLGAHPDPLSGTWCEAFEQRAAAAELLHFGCSGCPRRETCDSEPGRHRRALVDFRVAVRRSSDRPLLVLATVEALRHALPDLPADVPIVLDDAGPFGGLVSVVEVDVGDVDDARDRLDGHASANLLTARAAVEASAARVAAARRRAEAGEPVRKRDLELAVPDVFVERLVDAVAGWAVEPAAPDLDAAVRDLPGPVVEAIRAGAVRPEPGRGWQWEPGKALKWTDAALRVIRAHLAGLTPTPVRAARGRVAIHIPDPALVERARAGRVLWLAVGAPPAAVAEALGADVVRVEARPEWLRTIAVTCRNWGSGRPGSATRERRAAEVQALARALAERCAAGGLVWRGERFATFGAVVHKSDRLALGDPGWCESFGRGHAAHDRLADADVLLVRRYAEPPTVLRSRARILGRAFGLEPADLLPEVEAFAGAHSMLNAIGRCRPFTAGAPRLAIVLDRQHPGLELPVDAVLGLAGLCAELDLSPDDQAIRNEMNETNERRAREAAELRERIRAAAAADPAASHRELAAGLGVGASTVRDHLAGWDRSRATPLNIYMGGCTGSDSLPTAPEIVDRIGDRWGLDRPTARRAAARALGRIRAAREAAGEDGEPVEHLGRLTGVAGRRLLDVLEACAAIAAERAAPAAAEVPDHLPAEWTAPRGIEAQVAELVAEIAPGDPVVELAAWLSLCGRAPPWIRQRAESLEAAAAG